MALSSHQKSFFPETITEATPSQKAQNNSTVGCPASVTTSTTQPLHLKLGEYQERRCQKIVRMGSPGSLLCNCVFERRTGSYTHDLLTMWLLK